MLVIAHRGFSAKYPENTMTAFAQALRAGADMIEMDVRLSADRKAVVYHDADLKRLHANRHGIAKTPYADLKRLSNGDMPLLRDVLDCFAGKLQFYVEIKAEKLGESQRKALVQEAWRIVSKSKAAKDCLIASFDFRVAQQCRGIDSKAWTGVITDKSSGLHAHLRHGLGFADACCPHKKLLSPGLVAMLRAMKKQIFPWVLDSAREQRKAMRLGVDGIVTNDPSTLSRS